MILYKFDSIENAKKTEIVSNKPFFKVNFEENNSISYNFCIWELKVLSLTSITADYESSVPCVWSGIASETLM